MSNIKLYKLISGEEIIGEWKSTVDNVYRLNKPATIVMQRTEQGVGIALMPYLPYAVSDVEIFKHAVASVAEPDIKLINEYNRIFGSGIEIVSASALK